VNDESPFADPAIARFVELVPSAIAEAPSAELERAHLRAMVAAMPANDVAAGRRPRWRRRVAVALSLSSARVAVGLGVALAGTAALAVAGHLPAPAQRAVSTTMDHVGIHLSRPHGKTHGLATASRVGHGGGVGARGRDHHGARSRHTHTLREPAPAGTTLWRTIACRCATADEAKSTVEELTNDVVFGRWTWEVRRVDAGSGAVYYEVVHVFAGDHARDDAAALASRLRDAGFIGSAHEEAPPAST
jgi:hypothetical protein